ncbi:MAG TPA: ABC transporter substrate-binding protein [Candidatus Paceibacterota bacterium]|nr:ABC transporter substrate-binding protein [Verrucomicrobiota bacterium]HRY51059.1 ABC transporter substrate-binding protein [Candidatus Paceibacterota bacterium]HRZ99442.1 ABC transporter substrate-binding protein [Candidatus Paceibacterota bacterium]
MPILKRLLLSLVLLGAATLVLLLSDLHSRESARSQKTGGKTVRKVAVLKHASNMLLDEVERGVIEQLAAAGYDHGGRLALQRFSAEGDLPTANSIAQRMTDGSYEMVITISTLSLQCVANANKDGRAIHVFGAVTDPAGAGVGIQKMNTTNKPPWLAGMGTFQPVEQIFREAKRLWPDLKVVGAVWNPTERNSEACTIKAREVCRTLGIQLIEANVDQSKDVREAAESLVARGAQAFWTGVDVTVLNATAALCETALKAKIPVFSNTSGQVRDGTLFDLGANYLEVGHAIGALAASILDGRNPASVIITNFMPERVMLNKQVLKKIRDPWRFPEDILARADLIIGEDGQVEKESAPATKTAMASTGRLFKIGLAYFGPDEGADSAIAGLLDGLRQRGLEEGRNLEVQKLHANGEISGIPAMLQSLEASAVDVIVPFSTPVITAACAGVRRKPVVFTYCSDPIAAGAGKSFEDHLPFVTGIGSFPPVEEALEMLKLTFPKLGRLGTLYNNAEANSVKVVAVLRQLCEKSGIELVEAVANNTSEVAPAAQALAARGVTAVYLPGDNTAYQAFEGLISRLTDGRVPVVIDAPEYVNRGVLAVVGVGYYQSGYAAAEPLARVLAGEKPAVIPLRNVTEKKVIFNFDVARKFGITFPPAVLAMQTPAETPAPSDAAPGKQPAKRWRIQQMIYSESVMVEEAMEGFQAGLKEAGLREGTDYVLHTLSAQGDMATLSALFDSAKTAGADLYAVYSTPTLQTAIRKVKDTPVVFTVVADPFVAGAGKTDADHLPNMTGVYTQGPYREMAEMLRDHFPGIKRVGTIFCPAEANSVANKDLFVREAARCGLTVETVAANSPGDLPDAAMALCGRRLDAVVQVIDNLSAAGFPTIARAATQARLPVFSCQGAAVKQGATMALARDYYDAGRETALKAARIMRGENPARIPFSPPLKIKRLVNLKKAGENRLVIPEALLGQAQQVVDPSAPH